MHAWVSPELYRVRGGPEELGRQRTPTVQSEGQSAVRIRFDSVRSQEPGTGHDSYQDLFVRKGLQPLNHRYPACLNAPHYSRGGFGVRGDRTMLGDRRNLGERQELGMATQTAAQFVLVEHRQGGCFALMKSAELPIRDQHGP